ncbi:MAG: hypothetical protein R6X20_10825 [Phycisphaerae bacterium]
MDALRYFVFENPATLLVVLLIATVLLGTVWRRTGAKASRAAAGACLAATVLVALLAWLVETDRERLERTLDTMARAADEGRPEAFIERISPDYRTDGQGKEGMADLVRDGLKYVRASAGGATVDMRDGKATVTQTYRFRSAPGQRVNVAERFPRVEWEGTFGPDADGEWRLRSARVLSPRAMLPQEAVRYLPGR